MSTSWVSTTANWIAAVRARESARPDRLFNDPYAQAFAGQAGIDMMRRSEAGGKENAYIPVRVRFFDDLLCKLAAQIPQVVLLGAGYDTRCIRLPLPAGLAWFELDSPKLIEEKEAQLAGTSIRCAVKRIGTDFSAGWQDALIVAGLRPEVPTIWLAEGLLYYLRPEQVQELFIASRHCSGTGSVFLADIVGSGVLELPSMQPYLAFLKNTHQPMPFTTATPTQLLNDSGWQVREIVQAGQPAANFGRLHSLPAVLPLLPMSTYLVTAELT